MFRDVRERIRSRTGDISPSSAQPAASVSSKAEDMEKSTVTAPISPALPFHDQPNSGYAVSECDSLLRSDTSVSAEERLGLFFKKLADIKTERQTQEIEFEHEEDKADSPAHALDMIKRSFFEELTAIPFVSIIVMESKTQKIIYVNQLTELMFNLLNTDLLGQEPSILMAPSATRNNAHFHHNKVSTFINSWAQTKSRPTSIMLSNTPQRLTAARYSNGLSLPPDIFLIEMLIRPLAISQRAAELPPKAFVAYLRDVSHESQLHSTLLTYKYLTEKSSEAMIVLDLTGRILSMNSEAETLFGYKLEFLLSQNANISLFMPKEIADKHDGYLTTFAHKITSTGYDLSSSLIVGKPRALIGRQANGRVFPLQLRVEIQKDSKNTGQHLLCGFFRHMGETIKRTELNLQIAQHLFPPYIARQLSNQALSSDIVYNEKIEKIVVILPDLVDFTAKTQSMDHASIHAMISSLFHEVSTILAPKYLVEVVKSTGDGFIGICGLHDYDIKKQRIDHAICFALELLAWAEKNHFPMRIGIGYGQINSSIFRLAEGRFVWDVLGAAICEAARMEKHADPDHIQLLPNAYGEISIRELASAFVKKQHPSIKGLNEGNAVTTYQVNRHAPNIEQVYTQLANQTMARIHLEKERRNVLKTHQEKTKLTSSTEAGVMNTFAPRP